MQNNSMYCKYCGKENKEEAKFCKYCGGKIESPFALCPFCKKEIGKDVSECPHCFKVIREEISLKKDVKNEVSEEKKEEVLEQKESLNYAGLWIRIGAFIIDYALLLIVAFFLGMLFPLFFLAISSFLNKEVFGYIMIIVYHIFFLSIFSSTPGKMLFGLQVIDANTKEKIKFGKALGRGLSYIISSFIFSLGFLWVAIDRKEHQGWHDKIAKTLVIKKKKKSLIFPIILSVVAFGFSAWMIYSGEAGYDFSFLGREGATILNSIQERISQQPSGFCCSSISPWEIDQYLNEIPPKSSSVGEKNAENIFEEFKEAIVTIGGKTKNGEFGFGSGFLISPLGLIVTNYHVIENMDKLAVAVLESTTRLFDANLIIAEDPEKDLAVLKIGGQNFSYIVMGDSDLMKVGQKVFAIGNPEGYTNTISEGIISQMREFENGIELFQITAPISQGSSGGALFNGRGEVIGITNMIYLSGQNINFAIPINYVKDLIGFGYLEELGRYDNRIEISENLEYLFDKNFRPNKILFYGIGIGDDENKINRDLIMEPKNEYGWIHMVYSGGYRIVNNKVAEIVLRDVENILSILREEEIIIKFGLPDKTEEDDFLGIKNFFYIDKGLIIRFSKDTGMVNINIVGK